MTLERLGDEIETLAAQMHAAMCRWLLLVAEFDRREGWGEWGCKSCAHWISWRCAIAPGAAREHVRVARRLEALPLVRAGFARGELSYSKVARSRASTTSRTRLRCSRWPRTPRRRSSSGSCARIAACWVWRTPHGHTRSGS